MADETNQTLPVVQTEVKQTSEVIDVNGNSASTLGSLSAIFDKIEQGKPAKEAVAEVMKPEPEKAPEATTTTTTPDPDDEPEVVKPEPEKVAASLDEAITESAKKKEEASDAREALRQKLETKPEPAKNGHCSERLYQRNDRNFDRWRRWRLDD